ncbi:cytochrome P450 [Sphingomonas spermidinifaciens]|uniref:Cytochrome P450 n=1 Tax=Sphingomonas spermidinifaciens TaxID=1141889 RepID=A0A2A4B599_9SPHN|nr:cytochrome P450 [Sphingomonas spermidinifaciens]PCD02959.1 cytochrome P450 [Sphingomonas spermidinifaciens]
MSNESRSADVIEPLDAAYFEAALDRLPIEALNVAQPELFAAGLAPQYLARLRHEAPVHYCAESRFGPYWSITRHADIEAIELNTEVFSSAHANGGITIGSSADDPQFLPAFLSMDPPNHAAQRKVVAPAFAPERLSAMTPRLRAWAAEILDGLPRGSWFDWTDRVSIEFSARTLALLLGFPQARSRDLIHWSDTMVALPGHPAFVSLDHKLRVMHECFGTFDAIRAERRAASEGDDLISLLARGAETRDMPKEEFYGNILLLIVGGNDTTRNSISGSILAMHRFPESWRKLQADRDLLASLTPELLRWQSPIAHMRRTAMCDATIGGRTIRRGDKVVLWYLSANRDEALFEGADDFVLDRQNARRHLAFGFGIHRCIGARLADLQIRTLWEAILERGLSFEVEAEPLRIPSTFINGYQRVLVRLS